MYVPPPLMLPCSVYTTVLSRLYGFVRTGCFLSGLFSHRLGAPKRHGSYYRCPREAFAKDLLKTLYNHENPCLGASLCVAQKQCFVPGEPPGSSEEQDLCWAWVGGQGWARPNLPGMRCHQELFLERTVFIKAQDRQAGLPASIFSSASDRICLGR